MQPGSVDPSMAMVDELLEVKGGYSKARQHVMILSGGPHSCTRNAHLIRGRRDQQATVRPKGRPRPIYNDQWEIVRPPSPRSMVDHGNTDPFSALPTGLPQSFVGMHLKKIEITIPSLVSSMPTDDHGPRLAYDLLRMAVQNKALIYCMFTATILTDRAIAGDLEHTQMELHITTQAVKYLREQMINPATAMHEANVWAVLILGTCASCIPVRTGKLPTQSGVLRELQAMHTWGRLATNKTHEHGLKNLVVMLGGLDKLKTPGMSSIITCAHILECTRSLKRVYLQYIPFSTTHLDGDRLALTHLEREWARSTLGRLGTSFKEAWHGPDPAMQALQRVIQNMCDFTIIVENLAQGRPISRRPIALTDQRNHTQHGLMILPSAQDLEDQGIREFDQHYEPCRLACIVYSLLVVMPLPPVVKLFERLSGRMQRSLKGSPELPLSRKRLQIWILTMGAIASIGTTGRVWFVVELAPLVSEMTYGDFVQTLQGFLWHPRTSSVDGYELWVELRKAA